MSGREPFKFGGPDGLPHVYPNVWARQELSIGERLVVAPAGGHVDVMLALAAILEPPLGVLWILKIPRVNEHTPGRYQSPVTLTIEEVSGFIELFRDFLERDGRHHLWIMSAYAEGQVVYDNHNVLYFYGDLDRATGVLAARGISQGEYPRFPVPHTHCYNKEYDGDEVRLMEHWCWVHFPLVEEHDDP